MSGNDYLSSRRNGRERERERVIVQHNACERVSDRGIHAQSRTNPDSIMCAGLETMMFTITDFSFLDYSLEQVFMNLVTNDA